MSCRSTWRVPVDGRFLSCDKKYSMTLKKNIISLTAGLVIVICISVHTLADINDTSKPPESSAAVSPDTNQLFQDMKILRVKRIASPVGTGLIDLNGNPVCLSEFKGKIVFVNFWTTWCGGCREEMPSMENLHNRLKDKDFIMVAIDVKQPASWVKTFFDKHKLTFTPLLDTKGKTGDKFGVRALPTTFILDKDGGIIGKAFGPRTWDSQSSVSLFEALTK